jgi:hypothetical protein
MTEGLEIAIMFVGMASLVAIPLSVLLGLPLAAFLTNRWLTAWRELRGMELDLQRVKLVAELRSSNVLPHYVDTDDPEALVAWARTDMELRTLS